MRRNFVRPARALVAAASVLSLLGVVGSPAHAAAGDLDTSFGSGGKVTTDFGGYEGASGVAVQSDGKIVVAGHTSGASEDFAISRYNANGSPDTSFDGDGKVTTDFGGYEGASAVAIQSDGKIVVVGYTSGASEDFAISRYNANGSPDTSFDGDGKVTTDFGGYESATAVAIQDGKIVVAGYTYGGVEDFAVARYQTSGALDTGFSGDGKATTDFGGYESATAVAIQSDGKVVVAGYTYGGVEDFAIARYNTNGTLDTGFSSDGKATTDFGGYESATAVAIQSDGRIVVVGYTYGGVEDFAVARYNSNGSLDTGFSGDGKATTDFGGYESASAVAVQPDGKIVVAGYTYGGSEDFAVARYQVSGGGSVANSSPAAAPDTKATATDQAVDIAVLANDTDGDGDRLSVTSISTPAHGAAGLMENIVRYLPDPGFAGTDTFTYSISDGHGGTATGTVTVTVQRPSEGVDVEAAGTVQSAPQATPTTPVAVAVTSPNAGRVTIADATDTTSPAGYTVLGRRLHIEAPDASVTDPLRLTFRVERSVLEAAGGSASTVTVFRNGVPAGECPGSTTAVPDPCVTSRSIDTNTDDVVVTVLAAHASDWFVGVALPGPKGDGYWMLGRDGKVYNFGKAAHLGDPSAHRAPGASFVDLEPTPTGDGYWIADDQGRIYAYNAKGFANVTDLGAGEQVTSISSTKDGKGLWIFTNRGRVIVRGDAKHYGDMSGVKLNGPVLDSIVAPDGAGYYMVASDGGVFTFGTARFEGSMGDKRLNAPVQSLVPDPDGSGYWLVASDGGVFAFGAPFRGSMGATKLNRPMAGMVPYGTGYLMVAEDGGIFDFSPDKDFLGSLGANPPAVPVISVAIH